jgi:uncharacterized protein YgiM (DUF1202 family)
VKHLTRLGGRWQLGVLAIVLVAALFAPLMAGTALAQGPTAVVVNAPRVNVRSDAGAGFPIIGSVPQGEIVELLGRNKYATWAQVRTAGGLVGWMSTYYLDRASGFNDLPIVTGYVAQGLVNRNEILNVRQGPGLTYPVVGTVRFGDYVNLLGRNDDSSWLYIQKNALTGWIASAEVEATVPRYTLPITNVGGQSGTTPLVAAENMRVNTAAGDDHGIITYLNPGEGVTVLAREADGSWLYIWIRERTLGWVNAAYITNLSIPVMSLPYLNDDGSLVGENLDDYTLAVAGAFDATTTGNAIGGGSGGGGTVPTSPTTTSTALVNAGALNVHSAPWWFEPTIFKVYQGQSVTLIGRIPNASWVKIDQNGQQGWVDANYLNIGYDIDFLPVFTSTTGY